MDSGSSSVDELIRPSPAAQMWTEGFSQLNAEVARLHLPPQKMRLQLKEENEWAAISHIISFPSAAVQPSADRPHRYPLDHVSAPVDRAVLLILLLHWLIYSWRF